jgi:hypothetical protein
MKNRVVCISYLEINRKSKGNVMTTFILASAASLSHSVQVVQFIYFISSKTMLYIQTIEHQINSIVHYTIGARGGAVI